ncbi:hypothetical protein EVAR_74206_1 [Eumeta japonica]|uniref:Uncharacterized protein n=1 Tax=Eumeta variegata TaxID=151549 RepID=A0A4C1SCH6_EUMVA|nr:hypothetical protein EVAR_74206_1 [Eumeta japonica]
MSSYVILSDMCPNRMAYLNREAPNLSPPRRPGGGGLLTTTNAGAMAVSATDGLMCSPRHGTTRRIITRNERNALQRGKKGLKGEPRAGSPQGEATRRDNVESEEDRVITQTDIEPDDDAAALLYDRRTMHPKWYASVDSPKYCIADATFDRSRVVGVVGLCPFGFTLTRGTTDSSTDEFFATQSTHV